MKSQADVVSTQALAYNRRPGKQARNHSDFADHVGLHAASSRLACRQVYLPRLRLAALAHA
jgi:hypothetical protein